MFIKLTSLYKHFDTAHVHFLVATEYPETSRGLVGVSGSLREEDFPNRAVSLTLRKYRSIKTYVISCAHFEIQVKNVCF